MYDNDIVRPGGSDTVVPLKEVDKENEAGNGAGDERLTYEMPTEMDIILSLASHSYIYRLGIAEDLLIDVAGYVYPVDFVILDIKEDKKRLFILGTPFLTTSKAVIKIEKGIKNDIEPIAPTRTINRLVLEWEERIKLQ
ncbi:reverse transcriptase domain-containing protein [Tanacetum coccineum]